MRIGLKYVSYFDDNNFRNDLLFFDKIQIMEDRYEDTLNLLKVNNQEKVKKSLESEINLLVKNKIVDIVNPNPAMKNIFSLAQKKANSGLKTNDKDKLPELREFLYQYTDMIQRFDIIEKKFGKSSYHTYNFLLAFERTNTLEVCQLGMILSIADEENRYIPILNKTGKKIIQGRTDINDSKNKVLEILMKNVPIIDSNVQLEKLISFRKDPDTIHKISALRQWINKISKQSLSAQEIEDEIEYLLSDYERHIQLHKLEYEIGEFQTWVTTGAKILDNLFHLKFGDMAESLFSFQKRELEFLKTKETAPGRELAYISEVKNNFR